MGVGIAPGRSVGSLFDGEYASATTVIVLVEKAGNSGGDMLLELSKELWFSS